MTACQILGNLCVLAMYNTNSAPCQAYQTIAKTRPVLSSILYDRPKGMPWLYYGFLSREDPKAIIAKTPNLQIDVSSGQGSAQLPLVLAVYDITGYFVGFQNLTTQFQYCQGNPTLKERWRSVGVNYQTSCSINLAYIVNSTNPTYFYEMYMTESTGSLYPVPIRIKNYRLNGNAINSGDTVESSTQLFQRFFTFDLISGIQGGSLQVLRAPISFQFT